MTIQPGPRIEAKAPQSAKAGQSARRFASRKFAPPRFPSDHVGLDRHRRWIDALSHHELCIVRAPAGYGKTAFCATLFAEAQRTGWRAGWVSFDPEDNESAAIGHIFEAARLADEGFEGSDAPVAPDTPASAAILADMLAERIDRQPAPMLLILDDVDRLTDARAIEVLDRLLRHPPAQLRLVLAGRGVPAVTIDAVERRGMALHIRRAELGLTDGEVLAFLQGAHVAFDPRETTDFNAFLEGWPAGLRQLAQRSARATLFAGPHDATGMAAALDHGVAALIDDLPDTARTFLQRSSVAPHLSADLCRLLGGESDGAAMLSSLAAQGLFIDAPVDGGIWYRLQPVFRAILRRRLDAAEPGFPAQLHRTAARYYAAQGMTADAIEQALSCGDPALAGALVADIAMPLIARGEMRRVAGWFEHLPPKQIAATPALAEAYAWLRTLMAHPEAPSAIAIWAASGCADDAGALGLIHRAYALDRLDEVVEACDQILAAPDGLSDLAIAMVRATLALGAARRGLFGLVHDAVRPLLLSEARPSLDLPVALATCARAATARAQGQLGEAERLLREGRRNLAGPGLAAALIDAGLARCCYERDDLIAAAELAERALPLLEQSGFQDALIHAFTVTIRVAVGMDRIGEAASLIDRAELVAFERGWAPLKAMCIVERARLRLPQTIDAETVVAVGEEDAAVIDPLSAEGRAFALLSEMRAYEAIANGDRPRLTMVAERLLRLGANADDAELRASAALFNILPQLSGRCDKMVDLETVRFLNHVASVGFRRTIVDVLDVTGVRAVQNFCSEAYSSGSFLALLKLAEPSRHEPALEGGYAAAPGEAFSFLTEREIEILSALNAGESNKEIARTLQLAPETVKWHLKNVMRKLRAGSREEAVQNASTLGLKLIEAGARP